MSRILITSVGSSPGLDIARCLRHDPSLTLIGGDAGSWGRKIGERVCDEVVTLPRADRDAGAYLNALEETIARTHADFLFVGLDVEVEALCDAGRYPAGCPNALAPPELVRIFLDKSSTVAAGPPELFPGSVELNTVTRDALGEALAQLGAPVWLRPTQGTSGQGSLKAESLEEAWTWISFWKRRGVGGAWLVQEFLPGRNVNWSGVYVDGERVAYASMERLEYYLGNIAVSGVTGQVRRCASIHEHAIQAVAERLVYALTPNPSGVFSVDLRFDQNGVPKVNEINPRLAGRPTIFAEAGSNLPLAAVRALTGRPVEDAVTVEGGRPGVQMYRQIGLEPFFIQPDP